ncbi:MAG: type II secretion system secretin GspD [Kofleriaceae bacterium]
MPRLLALGLVLCCAVAHADPELNPVSAPVSPSAAPGGPEDDTQLYHCKDKVGQVSVTFKPETELKDLVTWVMGFTCRNFMFDPAYVQRGKKVTIIAPNTMSPQEAYRVFLVALSTIGLTVVPKGNVLRIVESATARAETVPLVHGTPENTEQIVRFVLRPSYAQPTTLLTALNAMKSAAGDVQIVGTVLLVTDYATHVRDMLEVVKQIDVPGGTEGVYTIPIKFADADKLSKELEAYLAMTVSPADKTAPAALPPKLMVDARTNTLVVASSETTYRKLAAIVDRLDVAVETESGGSMHVYPLKAAIAEDVAKVMNEAISGQAKPSAATQGKPGAAVMPASADQLHLEGEAHVIADKGTNKLIVMSSGRDFLALKNVIQELDEPRKQVYIEATILEVVMTNDLAFGLSEHGTVSTNHGTVAVGGVQTDKLSSTKPAGLASLSGLVGGVFGPLVSGSTLLGQDFPTYGLALQALASNSNARILSAPSILALDNEESKYQVGTDIPYTKGTIPISAVNPTGITTTNIDRKQLLLELDIKPHISSGDEVLLEVKHSNNDLVKDDLTMGPTWSVRTIETRVVVKDQQTVVIGGLMQETTHTDITQVPILGDIPVLGNLFRYTTKSKVKTDLLVMLTPYIIRDSLDIDRIRQRRQREAEEFMNSMQSLESMKLDRSVDYARRRGLVEEINRSLQAVEEDVAQRAQLVHPPAIPAGPITPARD